MKHPCAMRTLAVVVTLLTVAACGSAESPSMVRRGPVPAASGQPTGGAEDHAEDGGPPATPPRVADPAEPRECTRDAAFPAVLAVAEASGAAEVVIAGLAHLLVAADSKNQGAAVLIPLPGGAAARPLVLPIDPKVSDDIEGLASAGGAVYALTSSGAVTRFLPSPNGFTREGDAYRIAAPPLSCAKLTDTNCGKNWEGLCLRRKPAGPGECAGYAASKSEGALYCVGMQGQALTIDPATKPIPLALPVLSLSDCAFGASALVVTTNDRNGSKSYVVDEKTGMLEPLPITGHTSNEAIQIGSDGAIYQFEDSSSTTSAASRHSCTGL